MNLTYCLFFCILCLAVDATVYQKGLEPIFFFSCLTLLSTILNECIVSLMHKALISDYEQIGGQQLEENDKNE